jgi:L-lactate dehydrogenase complex protein LldG
MRERILARVREASARLPRFPHPGPLPDVSSDEAGAVALFEERFRQAGGEIVRLGSVEEAGEWVREFGRAFGSAAVGPLVPPELVPNLPAAAPEEAALGVSMARCAAAETGSLLLDARDARRVQLLPPVHLVWVGRRTVRASLREALRLVEGDLPSCLALHSGPSKSADIGQIIVTGVHGPGRVIAALIA